MHRFFTILADSRRQLLFFSAVALVMMLLTALISPMQIPVVIYKLSLPLAAAILGLFFDFALFPFARPDSYLDEYWKDNPDADNPRQADYPIAEGYVSAFNTACLRRAVIVAAFVLGVSLGL